MGLELYSFVIWVRQLSPHPLGNLFTVKDQQSGISREFEHSKVGDRLRVQLSEFKFLVEHIPGVQNIDNNGLTRVMHAEIPTSMRYMFEDRIPRIFRLGGRRDDRSENPRGHRV